MTHTLRDFTFTIADKDRVPRGTLTKVHVEDKAGTIGVYCQMTDRDIDKVKPDIPVEMTFRKMHDAGNMHTYYWKCRIPREA